MADEEDLSSLPLPDRFAHKNWKVRKEAYEAAANEFKNAQTERDPVVREFVNDSGLWKGAVSDSNVAAHQEALAALCQFLDIAGTQGCTRTRNSTIAPIAEKGLTSTKPVTKQKAQEAILLYVELDKAEPVLEELLPLLSHKLPKIVAAVLASFTSIYHEFGCKTVDPKPVLKALPKAYGHADKNVRAEAQNLTVELYKWLREGIKPLFWNDLKPVQQTDLEKLFEKVKDAPPPKPERLLRSQQARQAAAATSAAAQEDEYDDAGQDDVEIDLTPDAVNVFANIPKDFQERMASAKWKDRKEALDDLHNVINVASIAEGPFDEIIRTLAKSMKDANIAVVTVAANCVELLAKGLRKNFSKYRSTILDPMLERLKERKQTVVDALAVALDAVAATSKISEYLEGLMEFLKHKNPQVKLESTRFLTRSLKTTREAPSIPEVKLISESAIKSLSDSQETQRNAAAEILGVLLKIMSERIMNTYFEGLDDIRKAKIKEFADAAEVKAKYKPKAAPAPKAAVAPPGKRPAGSRGSAAPPARKTAPAPAPPPPVEEPPPAQLQPKPTARPGLQKPGAPRGLKPPSAVGSQIKKSSVPEPAQRNVYSPPATEEEDDPIPAPKAARGLAGRQLNKPSTTHDAQPQPAIQQQFIAALPSHERLELDEIRLEVERLRLNNERLNKENGELATRVQELEDHNAQLIEDHTRDVLSIKAKETQLVRARSDAEAAEQTSHQLQREIDRLKRELGRTARTTSPRANDFVHDAEAYGAYAAGTTGIGAGIAGTASGTASQQRTFSGEGKENLPLSPSSSDQSAEDALAKKKRAGMLSPPPYNPASATSVSSAAIARPSSRSTNASASPSRSSSTRSYGQSASSGYGQSVSNSTLNSTSGSGRGIGHPPSFAAAPPSSSSISGAGRSLAGASARSTGLVNGSSSNSSSGMASANHDDLAGASGAASLSGSRIGGGSEVAGTASTRTRPAGEAGGQESWRRAAEVTQNLKARIELMRQRQQNMTSR